MKRILSCLMLLVLVACTQGPDEKTVRADVAAQLDAALPEQGLEFTSFERRGSQKDPGAPQGETRRIIYFDAELKLEKDINFGSWDSAGVSALVSALGAGPRGIEGITSGGNSAGDVIEAHGTAVYRKENQQWALVAPGAFTPGVAPGVLSDTPRGPATSLATIATILKAYPSNTAPEQNRIIDDELRVAQRNIQARIARSTQGYALAAGTEHGQYLRVARALSASGDLRIVPLITRASLENLALLRDGKASLALAQGDLAQDALDGTGAFDTPYAGLRAIGSLYPEPFHVLTRADSNFKSIENLRGKRVALGGPASRETALRVLEAHGLGIDDIEAVNLSISGALLALQQKKVDAIMQVIGTPADSIRDLVANTPMRLLPLSDEAVAHLVDNRTGYFQYVIASGTYPGQAEEVPTIATAALLLTDTSLSDAEIEGLTRQVFAKGRDYPGLGSAQGAQISLTTSSTGLSVPLHPAAARALDAMSKE